MQNEDLKQKNGFFPCFGQARPKRHGILKTTFGLKLGEPVENKRRENRRERGREEGRRRRGRASKAKLQKGMELLTLCMDPWFYLVNGIPQT